MNLSHAAPSAESVSLRAWDTEFFGVPIGETVWAPDSGITLDAVEREARAKGVRCLYIFCDEKHGALPPAFSGEGFKLVEERILYAWDPAGHPVTDPGKGPRLRPVREGDMPRLRSFTHAFVPTSRFFRDGAFSAELCGRFYSQYVDKEFRENAETFWVADVDGKPAGFVTLQKESPKEGRMVLIAVDPDMQGRGIGRALIDRSFRWIREEGLARLSLRTQKGNPACILYEKAGFRAAQRQRIYHRWL